MKPGSRKLISTALLFALLVTSFSCSSEFTRSATPVELVVTNSQDIQRIDLEPGAPGCNTGIGTIEILALLKAPNINVDQRFNDVRLTRYRVSYIRTDGGTLVPAPFVRTIDILVITGGGPANLTGFLAFQAEAFNQAPFAALLPQNGGRDPETGRRTIRMDVVLEVFGETLAGSNVSGRTSVPLDFCFDCNGCA
jgi:hypothetical protein